MTLAEILALRPADDADAATLQTSVDTVVRTRAEQSRRVDEATKLRTDGLLDTEDKALLGVERNAAQARLAIDRLDALLPDLRIRLAAARGRETVEALRAEAAGLSKLAEDVCKWQQNEYPKVVEAVSAGLHVEMVATTAFAEFYARVDVAYRDPAVRDTGPLDIALPTLDGVRPSLIFPNWTGAAHG